MFVVKLDIFPHKGHWFWCVSTFDASTSSSLLRAFALSCRLPFSKESESWRVHSAVEKSEKWNKKHKRKWLRKLKSIKTTTAPASVKTKRTQVEDGTKKAKKGLPKREKEWESEREGRRTHMQHLPLEPFEGVLSSSPFLWLAFFFKRVFCASFFVASPAFSGSFDMQNFGWMVLMMHLAPWENNQRWATLSSW